MLNNYIINANIGTKKILKLCPSFSHYKPLKKRREEIIVEDKISCDFYLVLINMENI
jgi:hypothetical protein